MRQVEVVIQVTSLNCVYVCLGWGLRNRELYGFPCDDAPPPIEQNQKGPIWLLGKGHAW